MKSYLKNYLNGKGPSVIPQMIKKLVTIEKIKVLAIIKETKILKIVRINKEISKIKITKINTIKTIN